MKNIKAVMDKHFASVKVDINLLKRIQNWLDSFRTKNEEHIHFFGSNSFGVHKVVMTTADRLEWIIDILDLEEIDLRDDIIELPSISADWKKYTDVMNLSCVYLIHRFYHSNLSPAKKEEAMVACAMVINIKFLTSFMNTAFKYMSNEETSEKVYSSLSYKYSLKKNGTWDNLLLQRSQDMVAPTSPHYPTIKTFEPDKMVMYFISDPLTRIKDLILNLYQVMLDVKDGEAKHLKSSMMVEMEDGVTVRDVAGKYDVYRNYIHNTLTDRNAFIKAEIANVVLGLLSGNLPPPVLNDAIIKFYELYNKGDKDCQRLLELILQHSFDQIQQDKEIQKKANNVAEFMVYMHSIYTASRSKGEVEEMRKIGERFIKKRVKGNNSTIIASARTGLMLYILVRIFLKDHY